MRWRRVEAGILLALAASRGERAVATQCTASSLETCSHTPSVARTKKRSLDVRSIARTSGRAVMYGNPSCNEKNQAIQRKGEGVRGTDGRVDERTDGHREYGIGY